MDSEQNNQGMVYHAGFPNASEGAGALALSLDKLVVRHAASTYFWRLDYAGVPELGWRGGDIAVVDRALVPKHQDYVVAVVDEEFVVRQFVKNAQRACFLRPDGEHESRDVAVWGVVSYVVHQVGRAL